MAARDEQRPERPDRVTLRDVYDTADRLESKFDERFATKADLRMWVGIGLVGGQTAAAAITALVTNSGPMAQAAYLYGRVKGLV